VPVVALPTAAVVVANVLAWAVLHAGTGYAVHRLPLARLQRDGPVLRVRAVEGALYRRLRVRHWKDRLPEAGALFAGGVSKRHLPGRDRAALERFMAETRRAERGHWLALAGGPVAVLWNPPVGAVLMVAYGIVVNAPFIVVQRYNRLRTSRVLARSAARSSRSTSPPPR
jgi:glycosyl-4,4'-diaponeurosporenoate acyltransferase